MIEIGMNQVIKNYGYKNILKGAAFEIMTGDRTALTGRNGSGKTTIFKILTGEETADSGMVSIRKGAAVGFLEQISQLFEETTTVKDVLMSGFSHLTALEEKMQMLEEKMSDENGCDNLEKVMKEYSKVQNQFITMDGYSLEENFKKIVEGFGLGELLERNYNILSGGQKTIVRLATTILKQPDILLLDEPTNHLDIKTLEWFEQFIAQYKGTVVFISHDRYFLDKVATKTIVLENGTCSVFNGNYSYCLKEQERLLLLEFEDYKNQQKKIAAMKAAIKRFREWGAKGDNEKFYKKAKELERKLEQMELIDKPKLDKAKIPLNFTGERSGQDVLTVREISLILGNLSLFESASMDIRIREKVCLLGENGTGKTSLIQAILGNNSDYSGLIKLGSGALIGYIPQEIRFSDEKATILEAFREEYPCPEGEARKILAKYFFYGENVFKRTGVLSGGEKVLLKLAILVQKKINFLILDEPTNHIDIETREMLEETLADFSGTLLFISHDRFFINKIAGKIIEIKNAQLNTYVGNYDELRNYQQQQLMLR